MSEPTISDSGLLTRAGEEVWETTVLGMTWLKVGDGRGGEKDISIGGTIGQRLRIKTEDRIINQEICINKSQDPFTNGSLVRVDADQSEDPRTASPDALSVAQMEEIFNLPPAEFSDRIDIMGELSLRRMKDMAEGVDATASQIRKIKALIEERYPLGGAMPIYDELKAIGSVHQGA
jgi:hypothetical protein